MSATPTAHGRSARRSPGVSAPILPVVDDTLPGVVSPDRGVLAIVGALMVIGVVMVYSASVSVEGAELNLRQWHRTPLRQCVFAVAGFLAMLFVSHVDYRVFAWRRKRDCALIALVYGLALACLLALNVGLGDLRMGAVRSITVLPGPLPLSFQPPELAKIALILGMAGVLARPGWQVATRFGYYFPLVAGAALIVLTVREDLGTAALLTVVLLALLYVGGARKRDLSLTVVAGVALMVVAAFMRPYRLQRVWTWWYGAKDPLDDGYQIGQSLLAIGSGGWWGRGLGAGVRKYGYLPQDNNDFIFAILCEELGVAGGLLVMVLFLCLLARGWHIARQAVDPLGRMIACGVTLTIFLQAVFNIAVVTNTVPTKGISLPFVSAGGSGILFLGVSAGLLASVGGVAWSPKAGVSRGR
ncbi:MAG: FtsW/RodA/SpoVE family cell cycle protein [Phycisphaerales bacterium]|nr:FtsW/RodA/SpoVE family cell cycle protein [Phycisphaerales bacterium]